MNHKQDALQEQKHDHSDAFVLQSVFSSTAKIVS